MGRVGPEQPAIASIYPETASTEEFYGEHSEIREDWGRMTSLVTDPTVP